MRMSQYARKAAETLFPVVVTGQSNVADRLDSAEMGTALAARIIQQAIDAAIAERDRQWVEAIAPGNADTYLGKVIKTPEAAAEFLKGERESAVPQPKE